MENLSAPVQVGIFDSGVGGLSVLRVVRQVLPAQPVIYLADQAHVPYGARTRDEVQAFSEEITRFLLSQGAKLVVVACNTASAAALYHLRKTFPDTPFVGMEPAVKPAAVNTHSGAIGVLATPVTFAGELYASVVERFASGVRVFEDACPGLVDQIEAGHLDHPKTRLILERALLPMISNGVDTVVMGCTHYPFVIPLIQEIAGSTVKVIDPAPAVVRQVKKLLSDRCWLANGDQPSPVHFYTSGGSARLEALLPILLGESHIVQTFTWQSGKLI